MCAPRFSADSFLANEAETTRLGVAISGHLEPGDCLLLEGPIGAGKTHLARAIIQARLAIPEDVPSPTFTIVQTYDVGSVEFWHADLYRLNDVSELVELGLEDAFQNAVVIVEWPDRLGDMAPEDALHIALSDEDDGRRIKMTSTSLRWQKLDGVLDHG